MADENKPAFYPRVGNIKAKNFRSAQPAPFINDPRAMDVPQYGENSDQFGKVDVSVPSRQNLDLGRRMTQRDAELKRQLDADTSPLEKVAGALEAVRFMGSALTQSINAFPTRVAKGDEAADKFIQDRIYKPTQPKAYEYAQDIGDFLERLETEYKLPPVPTADVMGFAPMIQAGAADAARRGTGAAIRGGLALERGMEPVVRGALERGGLPREMVLAMGANSQSNVMKPSNKANWLGGSSIHVPERDMWRFKTQPIAGETPAQRIPHHEELLNDPTLNLDQLDRVKYQLEQTRGEAALDNWVDTALMGYFKGQLASPTDPVRLFIEKNYATIEAKFAKDQERAARMAQRAEAEVDPRRKGNMTRQAEAMMAQARDDRDMAMQNISHLPPEMLRDIELDPKSYIKEERVKAGFPAEGMGITEPSKKWEHQADEAIKVTRAGDIQNAMELQPKLDKALQEQYAVHYEMGQKFGNLLREKGLDEATIDSLVKSMPRSDKAEAVGMLDELQRVDSNYLRLLDEDRSFPKFAAQDNPQIAGIDPETKMYSGYMGDLGFEHVIDVLRQDVAAGRIRPDQLNKLSVEQAIRRTQEYNLERAKTMRDAKIKQQEGFPTHKEYPEGYKWIELKTPEAQLPEGYKILPDQTNYKNPGNELYTLFDNQGNALSTGATEAEALRLFKRQEREQQLADALKYEGDTMGHCVGGYCPDVVSGRSRIYSLRDTKGEPHVTVEVVPDKNAYLGPNGNLTDRGLQRIRQQFPESNFDTEYGAYVSSSGDRNKNFAAEYAPWIKQNYPEIYEATIGAPVPQRIVQIKGKQNAKPKDDYLPFVQDFVKSGKWSDVGDFKNTGLIREGDQIMTPAEHADWLLKQLDVPPEGMKRGGKVSISNNPDTMMLELNNQKMKNGVPAYGGAGAVIKQGLKAGRMSRAEAEAAGLYHPVSLGVKLRRPVSEIDYKAITNPKQPMVPERKVSPEAIFKGAGIPYIGDSSRAGELITEIAGKKLETPIELQGGMNWMRVNTFKKKPNKSSSWASGTSVISDLNKKARIAAEQADDVYGLHTSMSPAGADFSSMPTKVLLAQFDPNAHDPVILDALDEEIRKLKPKFVGVRSPDLEQQLLGPGGGEMRKAFVTRLALKPFQDAGLPNVAEARYMVSHPELLEQPVGTVGGTIAKVNPLGTVIEDPVNVHYDYPTKQGGEYFAGFDVPMTTQEVFPEFFENRRAFNADKAGDRRAFDLSTPIQVFDQKWLDQIMPIYLKRRQELIGKKKGGSVKKPIKKAAGGDITGDDLIIEERPL